MKPQRFKKQVVKRAVVWGKMFLCVSCFWGMTSWFSCLQQPELPRCLWQALLLLTRFLFIPCRWPSMEPSGPSLMLILAAEGTSQHHWRLAGLPTQMWMPPQHKDDAPNPRQPPELIAMSWWLEISFGESCAPSGVTEHTHTGLVQT